MSAKFFFTDAYIKLKLSIYSLSITFFWKVLAL